MYIYIYSSSPILKFAEETLSDLFVLIFYPVMFQTDITPQKARSFRYHRTSLWIRNLAADPGANLLFIGMGLFSISTHLESTNWFD